MCVCSRNLEIERLVTGVRDVKSDREDISRQVHLIAEAAGSEDGSDGRKEGRAQMTAIRAPLYTRLPTRKMTT